MDQEKSLTDMNSGSVCPQSGLEPPTLGILRSFHFLQMPHGSMYLHGHPTPSNPKKNCGVMNMWPTFGA